MCDKMAISAYILKIVEKNPFLRFQMRDKEIFNHHQFFHLTSRSHSHLDFFLLQHSISYLRIF